MSILATEIIKRKRLKRHFKAGHSDCVSTRKLSELICRNKHFKNNNRCLSNSACVISGFLDGRDLTPGRSRDFFLIVTAFRPDLRLTQPPIKWVSGAVSPGVKRPSQEGDNSPASSAETLYTSPSPPTSRIWVFMAWYSVKHKDNFARRKFGVACCSRYGSNNAWWTMNSIPLRKEELQVYQRIYVTNWMINLKLRVLRWK